MDAPSPFAQLRRLELGNFAIGESDRQAASALLALMLFYGAAMLLVSRTNLLDLVSVTSGYLALASYTVLLVLATWVAIGLVTPVALERAGERLFWLAVAGLLVGITLPFFGMFKQMVLPSRGFLWDRSLAHVSKSLFGVSFWTITHRWFGSLAATRVLDQAYSLWLALMFVLPPVVAVVFGDPVRRFRILLAWTLSWLLIGSLAAWYFASAGPCFYNQFVGYDPGYAALERRLAALASQAVAEGHPLAAMRFQPVLIASYRNPDLAPAGGISAMPSMHVAMATLMAIAGFARGRRWGALFSVYALLIWIGSIHFGWHYFIDGPVAAVMMLGVWALTAPLARQFYPTPTSQSALVGTETTGR